jgi:hypothetical protein
VNRYQKFGIIAGQVLIGFGFAILGGIAGLVIDYIVSVTSGVYSDLSGSIVNALIGCYFGLLTGICFDGYRFLNRNGRRNEFMRFLLASLLGLSGGLLGFYVVEVNSNDIRLSTMLLGFASLALPLTGTVLGSSFVLIRDKAKRGI